MKLILGSRRRRCLARVSVFLVTVALIVGMVGCDGSGDGGDYNPPPSENLEIRTWYDLDAIRDNLCWNYTLMSDLDSTTPGYEELASPMANQGKGWQPIGAITQGDGMRFTGTLDGQGYEICDLFINRPGAYGVGFVGVVGQEGVVENIGVVNVTVTGDECVGGLVGYSCGTVSNSYSSGNVTGNEYVGGLVGQNHEGTVSNSFWDIQTSGQATSAGGTGKNTTEMQDIDTFSDAGWNITAVAMNETNPAYIWNIVNNVTYPFLSWQS
jgi:hypothetical protein